MTLGEYAGLVVLKVNAMFHGAMANYVDVTNVTASDGGSHLQFTVLPDGMDLAQWAADVIEQYIGLLNMVALVPHVGAEWAKLFIVLLS
jgi:hypothetical protein